MSIKGVLVLLLLVIPAVLLALFYRPIRGDDIPRVGQLFSERKDYATWVFDKETQTNAEYHYNNGFFGVVRITVHNDTIICVVR